MDGSTRSSKRGMMAPMLRPRLVVALVVAFALVAASGRGHAGKPTRYFFDLIEVRAVPAIGDHTAELVPAIEAEVRKALAANPRLVLTLTDPPGDGATFPAWKKYLAKQKIDGAYRVNVEITSYEETVEDLDPDEKKIELRLTIRLGIRMFGEVIPMRTMGFSGDGGSTIKADVGRKLRPKDRDFNLHGAIELAVKDALAASLTKIEAQPKK